MSIIRISLPESLPVAQTPRKPVDPWDQWAPEKLTDFVSRASQEPEWLLRGLLPADSNILFSGKPKTAYKSFLAFLASMSVGTGRPVGLFDPVNKDGVPVLILEGEGGAFASANRFTVLARTYGLPLESTNLNMSFRKPVIFNQPEWLGAVTNFVKREGVRLVVVDSLAFHMRGNENDVDTISQVMRAFAEVRELGASVLFVHHLNKLVSDDGGGRDVDEEIRGSSAIAGFYDQHWAIRKNGHRMGTNDLTIRSKDYEELNYLMTWDIRMKEATARLEMRLITAEARLEDHLEELRSLLSLGDGAGVKQIKTHLDLDYDSVHEVLEAAIGRGLMVKEGRLYKWVFK